MTSMSRGNMPVFLLMTPIWKALSKGLHPLTSIGIHFPSKAKGLHTVGVTLVPPCSLKAFIDVIADNSELSELKKLLEKALSNNKWVIHYGL